MSDGDGQPDEEPAPGVGDRIRAWFASGRGQLVTLATGAGFLWLGLAAWAASGWGPLAGILFAVCALLGAAAPWLYVRVLLTPAGRGMLGTAFLILAQLTFGAGALVRRANGSYEWGRLREDRDGLFTVLSDGTVVEIDGDRADLPTVAWQPLAVVEAKTESNMSRFTVDASFETERPDPAFDDETLQTPLALSDGGANGWHIDASKLERWTHDAAGADLPRSGLRKALEEKGGEQQLGQLWFTVMAGVLLIVGFILGYGALIL